MRLTQADQQKIIQQESSWIDDGFAPIDMTGFPSLAPAPPPARDDNRFARDWRDTGLSRDAQALRQFVTDPDFEALERAGAETGYEDFRADVRDRRGERVAQEFKRLCPDYLPTDRNFARIVETLAYNALPVADQIGETEEVVDRLIDSGNWTAINLQLCYEALARQGSLDVPTGTARQLSDRERLRVSRLAQSGRQSDAIGEYLRCALDGEEPSFEMLDDPAYREVMDEAVLAVFQESQLDFVSTPERIGYLRSYAGSRALTLPLLQQAWKSCQAQEARRERGELLDQYQRPAAPPNLDELPDDSIDSLYHGSLREYARQMRSGAGILA